jgi:biopolymer transport protein ExbB
MQNLLNAIDMSSALQLLERGGPVVLIIGIMSIFALAVALMKLMQFLYLGVGRGRGVDAALAQWIAGHHDGAIALTSKRVGAVPHVIAHAMTKLHAGAPDTAAREDAERIALGQLSKLRSHLRVLEATAQVAPLLGLFGTVLGMMSAFQTLQTSGADADPAALAGGIWVALITTAVGLAVAIPAALVLHWFEGQVERETEIMEAALSELFTGPLLSGARSIPDPGASLHATQ